MELQVARITAGAVPCYECEHDLRDIPDSPRCPACGASANRSRHRQLLQSVGLPVPMFITSRKWMRTIAAACCLTIAGTVLNMLAMGAFLIQSHSISKLLGVFASALLAAGYIILSQREPASRSTTWTRTVAIAARLAPLLGLLLPWGADYLTVRTYWRGDWKVFLFPISVPSVAITWVLLRHIGKLARRANANRLGVIVSLLAWLAPAAILAQPFLSWYLFFDPEHWLPVAPCALVGYADFAVMVPYSMVACPRLDIDLVSMTGQSILSLLILASLSWFSLVLLRASFSGDSAVAPEASDG